MDEKEKKEAEEFPSEREAGKEPGRLERLREKARRLPLTPGAVSYTHLKMQPKNLSVICMPLGRLSNLRKSFLNQ